MIVTEPSSGTERRMVEQKLDAWRDARGEDGAIPIQDAIEGVFAEIAPLSFVLNVAGANAEPTFTNIGAKLKTLQGADLIGKSASSAENNSLIGQSLQSLSDVIQKKVPATVSGEFENVSGEKYFYRCILMPLSAASETINIVLGAISFKTEN